MLRDTTNSDKVAQFMRAMGQDVREKSGFPDCDPIDL